MRACGVAMWVCLSVLMLGCSLSEDSTTTGTFIETTNGVAGVVRGPDSGEVYGAEVRLRSKKYLSSPLTVNGSENYDTKTDGVGYFAIGLVEPGEYVLEILTNDMLGGKRNVVIDDNDRVVAVNEMVAPLARVNGTIAPSRMGGESSNIWMQVYGLERLIVVDSMGSFTVVLPEGDYTLRVIYGDSGLVGFDYSSVVVTAGMLVNLDTLGNVLLGGSLSSVSLSGSESSSMHLSSVSDNLGGISGSSTEHISSSAMSSIAGDTLLVPDYEKKIGSVLDGESLLNLGVETQVFDPKGGGFTVHFSFSYSQQGLQYLIMKGNTFSSNAGWSFFIDVDDKLYWRINPSDNDDYKAAVNFQLTEDMQHKILTVTGVVDREMQEVRAFVNGSSDGWEQGGGAVSGSSIDGFPQVNTADNITVGGSLHSKEEPGEGLFNGYFGKISIFRRVLTVEEIGLLVEE
ncbi:MAG: hypothetical protein OCC49_04220 [Fibrobacterales bacterium]